MQTFENKFGIFLQKYNIDNKFLGPWVDYYQEIKQNDPKLFPKKEQHLNVQMYMKVKLKQANEINKVRMTIFQCRKTY